MVCGLARETAVVWGFVFCAGFEDSHLHSFEIKPLF